MPIVADWRERRHRRRRQVLSALLLLVAAGVMSLLARRQPAARETPDTLPGPQVARPGDAAPTVMGGVPVVSLTGTPLDVGRRCGQLFKSELQALFSDTLAGHALPAAGLTLAQARDLVPGLSASIPQTMVDLLQGLADSSGLSYNDIVLVHALLDLGPPPEFAGYGATQPATRARDLLLAADWGLPANLGVRRMAVMAVDAEGLGAWCGVGPAGLIAPWLALNERGLAVAVTTTPRDPLAAVPAGLPTSLLALRILQDDGDIDAARLRLEAADRTVPAELMLAQTAPKLDLAVLESTPGKLGFRSPTDGRLVATGTVRELAAEPPSDAVYDRLAATLEEHAGELTRRLRPLQEADAFSNTSVLQALVQPLTNTIGVLAGDPAGSQPAVWVQWDVTAGTVTSRDEASSGASP